MECNMPDVAPILACQAPLGALGMESTVSQHTLYIPRNRFQESPYAS